LAAALVTMQSAPNRAASRARRGMAGSFITD
jgi:hypothetical protein